LILGLIRKKFLTDNSQILKKRVMRAKNNDSLNFSILSHLKKTGHRNNEIKSAAEREHTNAFSISLPGGRSTQSQDGVRVIEIQVGRPRRCSLPAEAARSPGGVPVAAGPTGPAQN
jgi:hypothetical protein